MKVVFAYRENGSPSLKTAPSRKGEVFMPRESETVSYQGIATLTTGTVHYIAFGDYYDGHGPIKPGVVYRLTEQFLS